MDSSYDVVIVGGGIGGASLASVLARGGKSVLVLEKSTVYRDKVRGEWIAPWGVIELQQLGLYQPLIESGAHHVKRHAFYGDTIDPATTDMLDLTALVPGSPGPLCVGHPFSCDLWARTAADAGATMLRGATNARIEIGANPSVTFEHDGAEHAVRCRIIIGADGRGSSVRKQAGLEEQRDPNHHLFAGLLIENAHGFPDDLQAIGAQGDIHFLVFPQGAGRARLYLGYAADGGRRFSGDGAQQRFLEAFALDCLPNSEHLVNATAAGPCNSYPNEDTWVDEPYAPGIVLIGDAAGHNDPIIGQGLAISYRDVRMVRDVLLGSDDWAPTAFREYGEERRERMRRLRFSARLQSEMLNEFGSNALEKRRRAFENQRKNPLLGLPGLATLIGPEKPPAMVFEETIREQLFA